MFAYWCVVDQLLFIWTREAHTLTKTDIHLPCYRGGKMIYIPTEWFNVKIPIINHQHEDIMFAEMQASTTIHYPLI